MIRRPPRSTLSSSSAASDVYKRQVIEWALHGYSPVALVGQTKADVRDTMVEVGDSSIMRVAPPWFRPVYEPSKRRLTFPNGSICLIYSGDESDQLRGPCLLYTSDAADEE